MDIRSFSIHICRLLPWNAVKRRLEWPPVRALSEAALGWSLLWLPVGHAAESAGLAAIEELSREAYARNPEMRAAYARWQAAVARIPQARSLPDPVVGYGYFLERMDTRQQFRVEQGFPGFGKRGFRTEVAEAGAIAAAEELESIAADIRERLSQALAGYWLALESAALIERNLGLLESMIEVANQRYRTGETTQADVLRLQSEAETLRIEAQSWRLREAPLRARVNAVVGRDSAALLPANLSIPDTVELPEVSAEALEEKLSESPDVRVERARVRQAERSVAMAGAESRPDVMLGVEYMENGGPARDEVMAMVSLTLPLWRGRYRAMQDEAAAELVEAEAQYHSLRNEAEAQARLALFEAQDALRRVRLFADSLLPRARQTLALVEAEYRTGGTSFIDLQEAQRAVLELELSLIRSRADAFVRQVEWERWTAPAAARPTLELENHQIRKE